MTGGALFALAAGLVLTIEGLVLALAPSRVEDALELLRRLPLETRRLLGLAALGLGVALIWLAQAGAG